MPPSSTEQCQSIKSKKHPEQRCPCPATKGEWCSRHVRSKVLWVDPKLIVPRGLEGAEASSLATASPPKRKTTAEKKKQQAKLREAAASTIARFLLHHLRPKLRRSCGPALFTPELASNEKDIYSYDSVQTIPFIYRFSFVDEKHLVWLFDLRFLLQLIHYGKDLINPFTQEPIPAKITEKLQTRAEVLRKRKIPIVYTESEEITPEQAWNQKVLDVFLKLTSLGYGANVLWFETLTVRGHELFYTRLYDLWHVRLGLTDDDRERVVPGHASGRTPLFRWRPDSLQGRGLELKWWRKQTLGLMRNFLTRSEDRNTQGCGALYILTALAQTHPQARAAFPWLGEL